MALKNQSLLKVPLLLGLTCAIVFVWYPFSVSVREQVPSLLESVPVWKPGLTGTILEDGNTMQLSIEYGFVPYAAYQLAFAYSDDIPPHVTPFADTSSRFGCYIAPLKVLRSIPPLAVAKRGSEVGHYHIKPAGFAISCAITYFCLYAIYFIRQGKRPSGAFRGFLGETRLGIRLLSIRIKRRALFFLLFAGIIVASFVLYSYFEVHDQGDRRRYTYEEALGYHGDFGRQGAEILDVKGVTVGYFRHQVSVLVKKGREISCYGGDRADWIDWSIPDEFSSEVICHIFKSLDKAGANLLVARKIVHEGDAAVLERPYYFPQKPMDSFLFVGKVSSLFLMLYGPVAFFLLSVRMKSRFLLYLSAFLFVAVLVDLCAQKKKRLYTYEEAIAFDRYGQRHTRLIGSEGTTNGLFEYCDSSLGKNGSRGISISDNVGIMWRLPKELESNAIYHLFRTNKDGRLLTIAHELIQDGVR